MTEAPEDQHIVAAVQALNSPAASPADRKSADEFLTNFQRHPSAWKVRWLIILVHVSRTSISVPATNFIIPAQVVISLICSPSTPSDAVIFSAQSLRRKVGALLCCTHAPGTSKALCNCNSEDQNSFPSKAAVLGNV